MHRRGDEAGQRGGDEGAPARADGGDERQSEDRHQPRQADRAELGQRLEVEAVRVANLHRYVPVLEPPPLEGAGARAEGRVRLRVLQGGLPHVEAAVARTD